VVNVISKLTTAKGVVIVGLGDARTWGKRDSAGVGGSSEGGDKGWKRCQWAHVSKRDRERDPRANDEIKSPHAEIAKIKAKTEDIVM